MIEEETTASTAMLDFDALREAIEWCEADALLGFYAEDAGLRVVNAAAPASPAFELHGRAEIEKYLRAVWGGRTHSTVEVESAGEASIEFSEVCEYPDGTSVAVRTKLELKEGRISRQLDVVERRSGGDDQEVSPGGR